VGARALTLVIFSLSLCETDGDILRSGLLFAILIKGPLSQNLFIKNRKSHQASPLVQARGRLSTPSASEGIGCSLRQWPTLITFNIHNRVHQLPLSPELFSTAAGDLEHSHLERRHHRELRA